MLPVLARLIKFIILTTILFNFSQASGQRWEIGGLIGGINYTGDLAKDPILSQTSPGINLWGRYNLNRHFSYRFGGAYGRIQGHDSLTPAGKVRMLSFRSPIVEFSNIIEFHFKPFGRYHPRNKKFTYYVLTGLNLFYFKPQGNFEGTWVDLQKLGTEGQYLEGGKGGYGRINVSIPVGAGIKFRAGNWIYGFEVAYRKTFTDYLDDVSGNYPDLNELRAKNGTTAVYFSDPTTRRPGLEPRSAKNDMRGDPHLKDWYIFAGFTISYRFTPVMCVFQPRAKRFKSID